LLPFYIQSVIGVELLEEAGEGTVERAVKGAAEKLLIFYGSLDAKISPRP
jgi:hypothetical protein